MSNTHAKDQFVDLLVQSQPRLFAFAVMLLTDLDAANEVLQNANRVLLEKSDQFDSTRDFTRWACGFIRTQAKAYYRDEKRHLHQFSTELLDEIALEEQDEEENEIMLSCRGALRGCLEGLTEHQRMLIELRYAPGASVAVMSTELKRPASSISSSLNKIRRMLADCVERVIKAEGAL